MGRSAKYDYPFSALFGIAEDPAGVYYILNTMSNRMRIGQSIGMYQRMTAHYSLLQCGMHTNLALQEDWNAFGEYNFEFGILVTIPDPETHIMRMNQERCLRDFEAHFMRVYRTKDPIYGYDFPQNLRRLKPQEKTHTGFFASVSQWADYDIARTLGEPQP